MNWSMNKILAGLIIKIDNDVSDELENNMLGSDITWLSL